MNKTVEKTPPLQSARVQLQKGFWKDRVRLNRESTIPHIYQMLKEHNRIRGWDLVAGKKIPNLNPHRFWDSDCTKWIEAAAYSLERHPDAKLVRQADALVRKMEKAQEPNGYLNMVGTLRGSETQWTNLRDHHELYCAGHLIEAAVAYDAATGKRRLLDVALRFVDHIRERFGKEKGKLRGYPGHPEIEWALIRLYRHTGDKNHLELAAYFIDERGQEPHFYDIEAKKRMEDTTAYFAEKTDYRYLQAHEPVREQKTAEGHAVRAVYLYTAMAAMGQHSGEPELRQASDTLWRNIVDKRLYVTGGIGSTHKGERFTTDYDLPNEQAYCETCAAVGLILFAGELFTLNPRAEYHDITERALYNALLPGVSLDGKQFFYDNPLGVQPPYKTFARRWPHERFPWHGCACCPPNLARLIASIDDRFIATKKSTLFLNHFTNFSSRVSVAGTEMTIRMQTRYPWDGNIRIRVSPKNPATFTLALRRPSWNRECQLLVNGESVGIRTLDGYQRITRLWQKRDTVEWILGMEPTWLEAHPEVRHDCGRLALQRGPVVFCVEEQDQSAMNDLRVRRNDPLTFGMSSYQGETFPTLSGSAYARKPTGWDGQLYRASSSKLEKLPFKAIPFFMWGNRKPGAMKVWINECL